MVFVRGGVWVSVVYSTSKGKKHVGVDGVDDGDDVERGRGGRGATTQPSHVDNLIDPFFPRLLCYVPN
jgi:hypothetical protein